MLRPTLHGFADLRIGKTRDAMATRKQFTKISCSAFASIRRRPARSD
jgi:hypothetical protein